MVEMTECYLTLNASIYVTTWERSLSPSLHLCLFFLCFLSLLCHTPSLLGIQFSTLGRKAQNKLKERQTLELELLGWFQ